MEGVAKTKEVNINTVKFWNEKWGSHGGGERDNPERFKPMARKTLGVALDVGCGFGHLCKYLYERGCEPVYGVDFSVEAIKRARKNYAYCEFIVADAAHLPFRDSSFDSVTLAEVLEHLTDYEAGLREAERVGERVVFTVPDRSVYDEHVWTFSEEGVKKIVDKGYYVRLADKWWMGVYDRRV